MRRIAGDEVFAPVSDRRGKNRTILLREVHIEFDSERSLVSLARFDDSPKIIPRLRPMNKNISVCLLNHVRVDHASVSGGGQVLEETANRTVGYRGGEKNVGVEKKPHRLRVVSPVPLGEIGFGRGKLGDALRTVNLDRYGDGRL